MIDYNRFLYARGNPLKYSDPTGSFPFGSEWEREFEGNHGRLEPEVSLLHQEPIREDAHADQEL